MKNSKLFIFLGLILGIVLIVIVIFFLQINNNVFKSGCFTVQVNGDEVSMIDYDKKCGSDVIIPQTISGVIINNIGNGAFKNKGIKNVTLPSSVTNLGDRAFYKNDIETIYIPEGSEINIEKNSLFVNVYNTDDIKSKVKIIGTGEVNITVIGNCGPSYVIDNEGRLRQKIVSCLID